MKILYEREKINSPIIQHYEGFIVKDKAETIEEAVDSYTPGKYSPTVDDAIDGAAKDSSRPNPEIYYVKVTYLDNELDKIEGYLQWESTTPVTIKKT